MPIFVKKAHSYGDFMYPPSPRIYGRLGSVLKCVHTKNGEKIEDKLVKIW